MYDLIFVDINSPDSDNQSLADTRLVTRSRILRTTSGCLVTNQTLFRRASRQGKFKCSTNTTVDLFFESRTNNFSAVSAWIWSRLDEIHLVLSLYHVHASFMISLLSSGYCTHDTGPVLARLAHTMQRFSIFKLNVIQSHWHVTFCTSVTFSRLLTYVYDIEA
ncbi:hypothetical protein BDR06DRAFT_462915 [Suillus hirtellus]|nr:hypothetical protein BDR06DRAFT_462915 [Suillus hirtellus]